jgi:uncharacterized membrane protein YecN with MAPEG domain
MADLPITSLFAGGFALALMELRDLPAVAVLSLGTVLAIGRLLHAVGMYRDAPVLRGLGILATYAALAGGGVTVILSAA